ncbi:MAG: HD domain-containing protein [Acidobacteria bacterium]|nr:HD domain-containing protein [Acidobacteriota bacterium]MDA1234221.1 HD domain-containing protein [Acidobacteriota bacterium]
MKQADHDAPSVDLSERFQEALAWTSALHRRQARKGPAVPYVAHLLAVCSLVLEAGGDEDEAIAALLHDAVEDQGGVPRLEEIRSRYGDRVARIVDGCTDAYDSPKPAWQKRKQDFISSLDQAMESVVLVVAADKLHKAQSTIESLKAEGPLAWERFRGRERAMWYYQQITVAIERRGESSLTRRLRSAVDALESL